MDSEGRESAPSPASIVAQYTVPTIILGATIALVGVVAVVMWSRREEAKIRFAEKSSMLSNLDDEDMVF